MKTSVLIVTPDPKLGELISNSLAESFQYEPHCFREPQAAIDSLPVLGTCDYLLIETTLGPTAAFEIGRAARSLRHSLKIVLISRAQPSAEFDELRPWRLLRQPFLVPDLFAVLDGVPPTVIDVRPAARREAPAPTWLDDPKLAAKTLQRLAVDTKAQEVMLLRENDLWAAAGQLNGPAVSEIMKMILGRMESGDQFDLLRFMRLTSNKVQHGVWARLLMVNVILAAIYDTDASINEMRTQTNALADALFRPLLAPPADSSTPGLGAGSGLARLPRALWTPSDSRARSQIALPEPFASAPAAPQSDSQLDWKLMPVNPAGTGEVGEEFGDVIVQDETHRRGVRNTARDPRVESSPSGADRKRRETHEPGPFDLYSVSYSCLLTPRFATQPLRGDLKDILDAKLRQICISYGWSLGRVEVLPDCLHWVVMVPPTERVSDHIDMVRRMTSDCVFEEFPEYAHENLSRDFWGPGYSLLTGAQSHTPAQIQDYVRNRRQQSSGGASQTPDGLWGSPSITGGG